jgi:hypothetical protein
LNPLNYARRSLRKLKTEPMLKPTLEPTLEPNPEPEAEPSDGHGKCEVVQSDIEGLPSFSFSYLD